MKKTTMGLVAIALLSSSLSATSLFFDRGFDNDFDRINRHVKSVMNAHLSHPTFERYSYPKLDMSENDKEYLLKFELAGMQKSDIKLSLEENSMLVLEGEKKQETKEKNSTYFREEISYGKFKRAMRLPKDANLEKMETNYKDGILTVTIPKKEIKEPVSKIIKIN
jgi:HSP20 family protein